MSPVILITTILAGIAAVVATQGSRPEPVPVPAEERRRGGRDRDSDRSGGMERQRLRG